MFSLNVAVVGIVYGLSFCNKYNNSFFSPPNRNVKNLAFLYDSAESQSKLADYLHLVCVFSNIHINYNHKKLKGNIQQLLEGVKESCSFLNKIRCQSYSIFYFLK